MSLPSLLPRRRSHAAPALLVLVLILILSLAWLAPSHRSALPWRRLSVPAHVASAAATTAANDAAPLKPRYLRLVYTQREPDALFCRSLFSALALGYPVPHLSGWFKDPASPSAPAEQILDVLRYLTHVDDNLDDDLVVLTTRPGIWFQLRPSVLVSRYLAFTTADGDTVLAPASSTAPGVVLVGPVASLRSLFEHVASTIRALSPAQKNSASLHLYDLIVEASGSGQHSVVLDEHAHILSSSWDALAERGAEGLPADVAASDSPLEIPERRSFHGVVAPSLNRLPGLRWPDARLAADASSGSIPIALDVMGERVRVDAIWRRLWTFDILRELMSAQALGYTTPVARVLGPGGKEREYWPYPAYGRGADSVLVEGREAMPLEGICNGFDDGAFRDGLAWTTIGRGSLFDG